MKDCNAEKYSYSCLFAAVFRPGEMPVISAFRARYWALIIRCIERTLPGRIIDARLLLVKNDWHGPVPFSLRGAKPGPVGIDESSSFSEETLRQNAENLKERGVVYTAQSIDKAAKVAANLPNRRVLLIMIGKT
ncbi:hypothetical protein [Citrobacter freundii]|uniref:hypothetical protein n=1 Tax=Citrobacter freundii TaxID=546 RepID=UPI001F494BFE|nr:hypothetical protein [Citrobacter freundii]